MARFTWAGRDELEARAKAEALERLRAERDRLLRDSDWAMLPDAPLTAEQRAEWAAYRQALRDLPQQAADRDPREVIPPRPPRRPERRDPDPDRDR